MRRTSILPAILMGLSLGVLGCADATTRDDVADARKDLREEQQDTQEAMREGQEEIADARQDGQPYTANRPVMDEDAAEARQEAQEEVADERQDEQQAAANLRGTQQQFQATQARDAFVKDSETKLAHLDVEINRLKESADSAEGQEVEALNQRIETLESQHERAEQALEELKGAELAQWQAHQEPVRVAINELTQGVSNVR